MADNDLFPTLEDLAGSEYLFRITDNCGETADRYTVATCDGDYIVMSSCPSHPQGVSQLGGGIDVSTLSDCVEAGTEIDLALGDLPDGLARHILGRINESWRDFMEKSSALDPKCVAASRDSSEKNYGLSTSAGVGIYLAPDGAFMVRNDGDPEDDFGPFATAREAMIATLPDSCSLCGPEYHPEIDVSSLEPTPGVADKIALLEGKISHAENVPH